MRTAGDTGARWMRVHGPTASVIFSYLPPGGSVFVCVDDGPAACWQITGGTADTHKLIDELFDAVLLGWRSTGQAGDSADATDA